MTSSNPFAHWHSLGDPFDSRYLRGRAHLPTAIDANALFLGEQALDAPAIIGRAEGRIPGDFVWTDHTSLLLISERLVDELTAASLSGWSTYPVDLEFGEVGRPYLGLCITGRCGPLNLARGEWVRKDDEPGRFVRGLFFDEDSWDGADFFVPERTTYKFVTDRGRNLLKKIAAKNVRLERLSDVLTSEVVIRNTPHSTAPP